MKDLLSLFALLVIASATFALPVPKPKSPPPRPSLVGSWVCPHDGNPFFRQDMIYTFHADGTLVLGGIGLPIMSGKWSLDGDTIHLKMRSLNEDGTWGEEFKETMSLHPGKTSGPFFVLEPMRPIIPGKDRPYNPYLPFPE